ncbi:4-aminobutyrate aminotransferase apoenzyme [Arthrobacter sp. cf158]|uniref:4-aminobutyrate--2-oxoglutarate transaminase n=1 Tax=Arthrobacter sp. cf158 TaxID=1761744 RepID=UPI000897BA71|nr:4-aminobutyrate--2-oxoglutarate transaminase [Arthrobacter sp. cf158]SDW90583.1 4-aminobutyrate aminotransferase apoenzyme [Arthrobacter sp. cf158]
MNSITGGPAISQQRIVRTQIPGPNSLKLQNRRAEAVTSAIPSVLPIYVTAAGGGILVDADGNQLIDLASGVGVSTVGNANPKVVEAVTRQINAFTHTAFFVTPYEGYVEVCEKLNSITPGTHAKRTALFNSGSEAVENAVKVARKATGRQAIVVLEHAYHGRTNLTLAMTAKAAPFKLGFGPLASEIYRVPASYPYRDGLSGEEAATLVINAIESRIGATEVAAIVVEPIQGEGGFIVPAPGYLTALQSYAHTNGILIIADEVQSGTGRTGDWFASEHEQIVPDLMAIGKGVGGGLPLSAVTGRAELMDAVQPGGLGGTYSGNPAACASALAAIAEITDNGLLEAARKIGETAISRFATAQKLPGSPIGDIRGRGAMIAIELVLPGTKTPAPDLARAAARLCHEQGVLVLVTGTHGNVIRLLPPLVIGQDLLQDGLDVLIEALSIATAQTLGENK